MQHLAGEAPSRERIAERRGEPVPSIDNLYAGYGKMEILHGFDLQLGRPLVA